MDVPTKSNGLSCASCVRWTYRQRTDYRTRTVWSVDGYPKSFSNHFIYVDINAFDNFECFTSNVQKLNRDTVSMPLKLIRNIAMFIRELFKKKKYQQWVGGLRDGNKIGISFPNWLFVFSTPSEEFSPYPNVCNSTVPLLAEATKNVNPRLIGISINLCCYSKPNKNNGC